MKRFVHWSTQHPLVIAIGLFVLLHGGIILVTGLDRPIYGDEGHFVATITHFTENCSLETLRTYNEMSTPFPFVLYALWGKLFGLDISVLRLFSLLVGFAATLLFFQLSRNYLSNLCAVFITYIIFLIQPYLIGFTMYVYTDMVAILGLLIVCQGAVKRNGWLVFIGLITALLCRQYAFFFVLGLILYYGYDVFILRVGRSKALLLASAASLIPLFGLFILWQGVAPDNAMRRLYLNGEVSFSLSSCNLYIACITIYLFPALLLKAKSLFNIGWTWAAAVLFSLSYFLAPIRASDAALAVNTETVGLFHRMVHHLFERQYLEDDIFYLCFIIGLVVVARLAYELWVQWRLRKNPIGNLLILSLFCFLLVMPFSYLRWEKYFMLLLPFQLILLLMPRAIASREERSL